MLKHGNVTRLSNLLFPYFLIIMTGIICYSGTFNVPFIFDDFPSIVENRTIKNIRDFPAIWRFNETRFLVYLSFALNFHFHGLQPFGYHLVNLSIHILTALTIYQFVKLIFITPELKKSPLSEHIEPIALMTSLLFVSHPVQTQAVTYIVQRTASMASFFYIISVSMYIKARIHYDYGEKSHILFLCLSLVTALMAMFTKEISATLPFCILFVEYFFFSPSLKQLIRRFTYFWPMLLMAFVIPVTYVLTHNKKIASIGLAAETDTISRIDYLLTQFNVIKTYLGLLFFPLNQRFDYYFPVSQGFFELTTFFSFLLLFFILMLAVALFNKSRPASFGIIWFYLTLMVESSFIPIRDVIFEHRLYLPSAGFFLTAATLIFHWLKNRKKALTLLFTFTICLASLVTVHRNIYWQKNVLLWNDALSKGNYKVRILQNLGVGFMRLGRMDLAIMHYDKAAKYFPENAKFFFNRGMAHQIAGDIQKAIKYYSRSMGLYAKYHRTYMYRGIAYIQTGQFQKALEDLNSAIRITGNDSYPFSYRSGVYIVLGDYESALEDANRAISIDKDKSFYFYNRAVIYNRMKSYKEAVQDLDRAILLSPELADAHALRGKISKYLEKIGK